MRPRRPFALLDARGVLSLEALFAFTSLLVVLALLVSAWNGIGLDARRADDSLLAFLQAESCASVADSMLANGGSFSFSEKCALSENAALSSSGEAVASAPMLARSADFDGSLLRVRTNDHYH